MITLNEIIQKLERRQGPELPGLGGLVATATLKRAEKIHAYLAKRDNFLDQTCEECCEKRARKDLTLTVYDSPWDGPEDAKVIGFCSEECEQEHRDHAGDGSFRYQYCDRCGRNIIERCPSNGWREYFRVDGEECEHVCMKCWQERYLKTGLRRSELRNGSELATDFYNHSELEEHGWKQHESRRFVRSRKDADALLAECRSLKKQGLNVLLDTQSMAIGGLEGFINIYTKPSKRARHAKAA